MSIRQFPSVERVCMRRGLPRTLAAILLGLQALLWGGGSILEARSAAESLTRYSHVEDQGTTACPPMHSHLDCLICRTFSGGATSGSAPTLVAAAYHHAGVRVSDVVIPVEHGPSGTLTRGPPTRLSGPAART